MFFDGIGIELHFIFEGDVDSPETARIFSQHLNAAQQLRPDGKTLVGVFMLNGLGRSFTKYKSPLADSAQSENPIQGENVVLETRHTYESGRFMAHIWRMPSVSDASNAKKEVEVDQIVVQAIRRSPPGQNIRVLSQSRRIDFPADQSSMWIDASLFPQVPGSDVSIMVTRPSTKQIIKAIFRYQKPFGSLASFPGVPNSTPDSTTHFKIRKVTPGSDAAFRLQQHIDAYILEVTVEELQALLPAVNTDQHSPSLNNHSGDQTRPDPSALDSFPPPGHITSKESRCLAHRAWSNLGSALADIASTISPTRRSFSANVF